MPNTNPLVSFNLPMDHLVILAADITTSLAFYSTLLPMIGFKQLKVHLFSNQQGLYLDFRSANEPEHAYHRYAPGLNHIGFTAESLEQIETIRQQMQKCGYIMAEIQNIEGTQALFIKDPDGLRIELSHYPTDGSVNQG